MRKPSPATVIAMVALFVALGGVAVAADGDSLILGTANTASKQTKLTGAAPNPQLRVENTSTDGNARGVAGLISSPSAASGSAGVLGATASTDPGATGVLAQNGGGGPALKAVVKPGAPPLAVNSSTKVASLNADQLDGISSNGFIQGTGSTQFARLLLPQLSAPTTFFPLPGLGNFTAGCTPESEVQNILQYTVSPGIEGTATVIEDNPSPPTVIPLQTGFTIQVAVQTGGDPVFTKWQIWTADGRRNATVWISLVPQGTSCLYGASALVQST